MITSSIKTGSKNFWPKNRRRPRYVSRKALRKGVKFNISFAAPAASWWDRTRPEYEGQGADWLKAGGVTMAHPLRPSSWRQNHVAGLLAFRPALSEGHWEAVPYTNDIRGGHIARKKLILPVLSQTVPVVLSGTIWEDEIDYHFTNGIIANVSTEAFAPQPVAWICGPYHGGDLAAVHAHDIYVGSSFGK